MLLQSELRGAVDVGGQSVIVGNVLDVIVADYRDRADHQFDCSQQQTDSGSLGQQVDQEVVQKVQLEVGG